MEHQLALKRNELTHNMDEPQKHGYEGCQMQKTVYFLLLFK